jgi:PAS domain S-box-containing protein
MNQSPFHGKLVAAFGAAMVILASVGVVSYRKVVQEDADQKWVEHTHLVLGKLDAVLTDFVDLETRQRGYIMTADQSFLESYQGDLSRLRQNISDLRLVTSDNPKQQTALDRLESLVAARIALFQEKHAEGLSKNSHEASGKPMGEVETLILEMKREEQGLLTDQLETVRRSSRRIKAVIVAGSVLAILLLFLAGLAVENEIRKRTRSEQDLETAEQRYHLLFDTNPLPVWVYDTQTLAFLNVNASAITHYGYSRNEFLTMTIKDIRPEEDVPALLKSVVKSGTTSEDRSLWRHRKKDGTLVDVEVTSHPLLYAGRQARIVVANDITERKRAEETLQTSEEKFRSLVQSANAAIVTADRCGNIADFNRGAEAIFGYSAREVIGKPLTVLMPDRFKEGHQQGLKRYLQTGEAHVVGKTVELAGKRKDGAEFPVELSLSSWKTRNELFFTGILSDITERKQAEEALRSSEERFRLMVSNVKDYAILMLDPDGHIVSWNEGAERIKGYRAEEIIGEHFSRFYPTEDVHNGKPPLELQEALESGRFEDEGWRVRKDGSRFWANVIITALRDETGRLRGFGKVTRDITERQRAEQELLLRTAELEAANKELEAFSYSVSHDLRAPLRAIDGFSLALLEDYQDKLEPEGRSHLERIRAGAKRMGHLIDDMLQLARIARAEMVRDTVNLSLLAEEITLQLQASQSERQATFVIARDLIVQGDRILLRAVLENLLDNAWKFTSKRPHACIEFGSQKQDSERTYFVRDNGAGFDMKHADKLFGVFQRLHRDSEFPGTGVGLATVQRIIRRHGGRIWAEALPGKGATFYFALRDRE